MNSNDDLSQKKVKCKFEFPSKKKHSGNFLHLKNLLQYKTPNNILTHIISIGKKNRMNIKKKITKKSIRFKLNFVVDCRNTSHTTDIHTHTHTHPNTNKICC